MLDNKIICDICNNELNYHSEHTLHLKFKEINKAKIFWWWYRDISNTYEVDICSNCYHTIKTILNKEINIDGFAIAYSNYCKMSGFDMKEFDKKIIKLSKKYI